MSQDRSITEYTQFLRNPLGLIGLITVVFETISVIALTTGIDKLEGGKERLPLIWMVSLFPIIVIAIIALLVKFCHRNLYGPSDYKDERWFVSKDPKRVSAETDFEAREVLKEEKQPINTVTVDNMRQNLYIAENMGLIAANNYFGLILRKDVSLQTSKSHKVYFDGVAYKGDILCVAEIKFLVLTTGWRGMLERYMTQMQQRLGTLEGRFNRVESLLVIVIKRRDKVIDNSEIEKEYYNHSYGFGLRIVDFPADK